MKSIIVYGDIHGCLDEFKKLRKKINPQTEDIEVSVGDFINKGPYSLDTLHYILDNDILSVAGNNEAKIIKLYKRYRKEGEKYLETIRAHDMDTILKITKNELKYLESLPYFLKFSNLTVVHGGIMTDTVLDENMDNKTKKQITLLRYLNKKLEPIPWDDFDGRYKFWSELYEGHEGFVVYGHHPFDEPKIDEFSVGIDTGCVYGGKLTAIKFNMKKNGKVDTKKYKLISVKAEKDYWN
jgi:bis(5'-nucleosyl)-tetraphosphatase (symmetrical)